MGRWRNTMPYKDPKDPRKIQRVYAWAAANVEKVKAYKKKYADENKDLCRQRVKDWEKINPEKKKQINKNWYVANKPKALAGMRKRQLAQKNRTPSWLTKDDFWLMEQAYELAALRTKMLGFLWTVDHIIPLQGKSVSGLHVPFNLQVITAHENYSKGNRV